MVIWITGLAGAGKTTLCNAILSKRSSFETNLIRLDGDEVRQVFGQDVGYQVGDRQKQFGRIQRLAKMLDEQGQVVLVGVLYSNPQLLAWNRANIKNYFEVYLKTEMKTLIARDQKQLYSKAAKGEVKDVVGVDIPWIPPIEPDFVVDSELGRSPEHWATEIVNQLPILQVALGLKR